MGPDSRPCRDRGYRAGDRRLPRRLVGGIVIGRPIGGLPARQFDIPAPFWFGFVGSALLTLLWREFAHSVHASEQPEPVPGFAAPGGP